MSAQKRNIRLWKLESLFKFENRRIADPISVHRCAMRLAPSRWAHRVRLVAGASDYVCRLCSFHLLLPPDSRAGPLSRTVWNEARVVVSLTQFGATWFQLEPTVHNVINAVCCRSMRSSIPPTSIFFDVRVAGICGTLTKARTDQRVARS
jgi:hypothetical protein